MKATTLAAAGMSLGAFLRDRRARLRPDATAGGQRRTPGLRREEVAQRAGVSVTWYTWLEQGRGGPPSEKLLERLAAALELDAAGRELLFLLAQSRPPPLKDFAVAPIHPALQRVLDAMPCSLAYLKTLTWDIVAWNAAAAALTDIAAVSPEDRNVLRRLFVRPSARERFPDWEAEARFCLAAFRLDLMRAGGSAEAAALVAELEAASPEFRRLWAENETAPRGLHVRRIHHPGFGCLALECLTFTVDSSEGLSLLVHTPATPADAQAVAAVLAHPPANASSTDAS